MISPGSGRKVFDAAIRGLRGKVPILGVAAVTRCSAPSYEDEHGLEGKEAGTIKGLGLLEVVTSFDSYDKGPSR